MSMEFNAELNLSPDILENLGLDDAGRVQKAIDMEVIRFCEDYVPRDTGNLARSAYRVSLGNGEVIYPGPYARYLYYGKVMGPNIPIIDKETGEILRWFSPPKKDKHLTGKDLEYDQSKNPLAGSFWFERMKADHLQDIISAAQKEVGGRS